MAPDVVERRTKGLEIYITTIIRRFPDMLESSHLDRYIPRTRIMGEGRCGGVYSGVAAASLCFAQVSRGLFALAQALSFCSVRLFFLWSMIRQMIHLGRHSHRYQMHLGNLQPHVKEYMFFWS